MGVQKPIIIFTYVFIAISAVAIFFLANKIGNAGTFAAPVAQKQEMQGLQ